MGSVDLRCPVGPRRLLAILRQEGKKPVYLEDNTVEFACSDCARGASRACARDAGGGGSDPAWRASRRDRHTPAGAATAQEARDRV